MKKLIGLVTALALSTPVAAEYLQLSSSISFDGRSSVLYDQIDAQDGIGYSQATGIEILKDGAYVIVFAPQTKVAKGCMHSLLWFSGVVVAATFLYRRMLPCAWVAGLAAVLFAVDDTHGTPAVWLANRNELIGVLLGLLALIAHDRWRRDGRRMGAVFAPLAFLLGLLAKESTVAIGAYLLAYALFLDRGTWMARLRSLMPCALIGALWWVTYKQMGYGATGSGWYIDPGAEPAQFARAVAARAPLLLAWQWLVPSDLEWTLSPQAAHNMWLAAMGFLVIMAAVLAPLVRRDPIARFWALGTVLSVLPACAAFPQGRLLFFVGIGGMGLLAQFIAAVLQIVDRPPMRVWRHLPARALCVVLILAHLGMAPLSLARAAGRFEKYGGTISLAAASLPSDTAARFQTVLLVNTPSYISYAYCALTRLLYGPPYLSRTLVLGSGSTAIEIYRPDKRTLLIRPEAGFLAPPMNGQPGREVEKLLFDQRGVLQWFDRMYRDSTPMAVGQRIGLMGVTVVITAVTDDGCPAEATFRFTMNLESPLFRWMQWKDGGYVPFELPAVGRTLTLPPATVE